MSVHHVQWKYTDNKLRGERTQKFPELLKKFYLNMSVHHVQWKYTDNKLRGERTQKFPELLKKILPEYVCTPCAVKIHW